MSTRQLGTDGFAINDVGIGCWQFGGDFGPMEEQQAYAILQTALEQGINFWDTADVYGAGLSESLIGRFLTQHNLHDRITVATKFGRGPGFGDTYTKQALIDAIDASRQRLQVDTIDLLQIHCIPTSILRQGAVFDWLREVKAAGMIRHFGASVESVEEGLICLRQEGLLSLQVIYNIFRQKLTTELLPQAQAAGVGIIVRLPLASGLLAGKYTLDTTFPATDHRNYNCDGQCFNVGETFAGLPFQTGVALTDSLKPLVPSSMTMAQFALRFVLDHPQVSVIIPGASSPAQARANAAVAAMDPLPAALHAQLQQIYTDHIAAHIRGPY